MVPREKKISGFKKIKLIIILISILAVWLIISNEEISPYVNFYQSEKLETNNSEIVKISRVIDGDTMEGKIKGQLKTVRLIGIDTPETVDPRKPVECFGKEASNKTKSLVEGKIVRLEGDETQANSDKYGRLLRYVFLPDGRHVNQFLIAEGYAFEYTYEIPYKYQTDFKAAEIEAREQKKGLWADETCGKT